jgi:phage shock protein PspC (stress-responsive transcriptional regulator)
MTRLVKKFLCVFAGIGLALPHFVWASGEAATNLVVVADTRRVSGILKYIANVYNTDPWLFAVYAVVMTAVWGAILGFLMDFIMERSGLDLKSRKILEH